MGTKKPGRSCPGFLRSSGLPAPAKDYDKRESDRSQNEEVHDRLLDLPDFKAARTPLATAATLTQIPGDTQSVIGTVRSADSPLAGYWCRPNGSSCSHREPLGWVDE